MTTPALELVGISKAFAGVRAADGVSFDVRPGEVHALLGENGAGKSTLIKIMSGVQHADAGELRVDGQARRFASPREARAAGIATVHQELLLFPELTVAENIFLGHAPRGTGRSIDWKATRQRARELLDSLECFELDVDAKVGTLSVANRQRVEIARALSQAPRVLIMDEPTAALAEADVQRLLDVVRTLRSRGVGIVYVSHRMPEIFALADRVTVLRDGKHVATHPIAEVNHDKLVALMVGRPVDQLYPKSEVAIGAALLEVKGVSYRSRVQDISFTLHAGEILGIAGLVGSGRTELAHTIFGVTPATAGTITLGGTAVAITSPAQARDLGIAYIPEDRGLQGLIRPQTIRENTSLAVLDKVSTVAFIRRAAESLLAVESIRKFGIRARGPEQIVRQLSGGNQQKVVLAKWLATNPRVLIMDEPTRGIDVGAKAEIHALISKLAQQGMAILMISSELPEVLGMSDRVLVMNGGRVVARFDRGEASADQIGKAMTHSPTQTLSEAALMTTLTAGSPDRFDLLHRLRTQAGHWSQELVVLGAIVVLFVVVGLVNPMFLSASNIGNLFAGNAYIAVAAIGMSMVIICGHIDVSVGSLIGVLAMVSGSIAVAGYPIWVAWLAPVVIGSLVNAGMGALVAYGRIPSIVVSLGMYSILKGGLISVTGGAWISSLPPDFMIAQFKWFGINSTVWFMIVLTILAALWLRYSVQGRSIYALGSNAEAARAAGIRTNPTVVMVFAIHGMFAGIASVLFATQLQVIQSTVPSNLELTIITAAVVGGVSILGGRGLVVGATLAAILFATISSALIFLDVSAYWLRAVQGLMILVTVLADIARRRASV